MGDELYLKEELPASEGQDGENLQALQEEVDKMSAMFMREHVALMTEANKCRPAVLEGIGKIVDSANNVGLDELEIEGLCADVRGNQVVSEVLEA